MSTGSSKSHSHNDIIHVVYCSTSNSYKMTRLFGQTDCYLFFNSTPSIKGQTWDAAYVHLQQAVRCQKASADRHRCSHRGTGSGSRPETCREVRFGPFVATGVPPSPTGSPCASTSGRLRGRCRCAAAARWGYCHGFYSPITCSSFNPLFSPWFLCVIV